MKREPLILLLAAVFVLSAGPAWGDWDEGQPHKMHWPQLPDPTGWDVNATQPAILADDFQCTETGFIKDIHFWGSWKNGVVGELTGFQLSYHADIPDPDGDGPLYSQPGQTISDWFVPIADVVVRPWDQAGDQGWYDPLTGEVLLHDHTDFFQYNIFLPETDWLQQDSGNIYWLNISAVVVGGTGTWGWKSTPENLNFNDDGVYACWGDLRWGELYHPGSAGFPYILGDVNGDGIVNNADVTYLQNFLMGGGPAPPYVLPCVQPAYYPAADVNGDGIVNTQDIAVLQNYLVGGGGLTPNPTYPPMVDFGPSLNMSFVITNGTTGDSLDLKWQQLPDTSNTGFDVSDFNNPQYSPYVLADDFLCTETGPIMKIVVYASWYHDVLPLGDPRNVNFTLSIHSDIPDPDGPGPEFSKPGDLLWLGTPTFDVEPYAVGLEEGWLEPPDYYTLFPDGDSICWKYTFYLDSTDFIQEGTPDMPVVYWLDVQAYTEDLTAFFGWKTTLNHWNDDAVWANGVDDAQSQPLAWNELRYVAPSEYAGQSVDLAFEIWGRPGHAPLWDCEQYPPPNKTGGGYETENNDACTAGDAAQCEYAYCGIIDPTGIDPQDWWQFVVPQDTCYCVDVRVFADYTPGTIATGGGLDPELTVYAADCTTQLFYNNDKNGTLPQCEGTDAQYDCNDLGNCHAPGTVLNFKVSPAVAGSTGPYLLVINCYQCTCPDEPVEDTCEYYKAPWEDYAPNGMPDFDQKQDTWIYPGTGAWSYCGPVALANCLWWFDSKFEPLPADPRPFYPGPGSPGLNDHYPLLPSFDPTGLWDDHDTMNVMPFVDSLALYCNTNVSNSGTNVFDLYNGALAWLAKAGLSSNYTVRLLALDNDEATYELIRDEILRSQDVILLLGFYQDYTGICERVGGHYVTCAGVCTDALTQALCISDPYFDGNETVTHSSGLHNDTYYVSGPHGTIHHDRYDVIPNLCPMISPPYFQYELAYYPVNGTNVAAFHGQNLVDPAQAPTTPNPGFGVHTVIEYALIICPVEEEIIDSVSCEPMGGANPPHPPTFWYDVYPNGTVGLCDFHVVTHDSVAANYSAWIEPTGWTHIVHKVGTEWWVSWYDASCSNPLLSYFRFEYANPNPVTWSHWTTTSGGSTDPFTGVVDSSGRHSAGTDGYGYRVHAPLPMAAVYDSVVCEPQGAAPHPPNYWYDVLANTPGGLCDFHVVVVDSTIGNYSGWLEPAGWTHSLHKVGSEWWVSWYNGGCTNPITSLFRFGFTNVSPSTFGHWTTTQSGLVNPLVGIVDSSGNHSASVAGYGYTVHVPTPHCCLPTSVGDCDQSGSVDITDISILIDNQFLTLTPLVCDEEGNINYPGTSYPFTDMTVDITDLSILIDNQFLTLQPLPPCP